MNHLPEGWENMTYEEIQRKKAYDNGYDWGMVVGGIVGSLLTALVIYFLVS